MKENAIPYFKQFFLKLLFKKYTYEDYVLLAFFALGFIFFCYFNLFGGFGEQQFVLLARSFLNGHLDIGPTNVSLDASYYKGLTYWPQGAFPAVLLTPFVLVFGNLIHQGNIQLMLNVLNCFLLYHIAYKITENTKTSLWLTAGYLFSTVYFVIGMFPWSWWYAHVVATSAVLLVLYEYFHKRRWWVMGIFVACAMATRIDLLLSVFFPLLLLLFSKRPVKAKILHTTLLFLPIAFALVCILAYNFARFGHPVEFGYTYHIAAIGTAYAMMKEHGTWSLFYVPTNLYYLFLKGVDAVYVPGTRYLTFPFLKPDVWGMSIFLTSPILIWCLRTQWKERVVKIAAVTAFFILLFLVGYFGIGSRQYGYRYALDFSPFLFVLLCYAFQKGMGKLPKVVIIVSFFVNLFLFPSIFSLPLG